MKPEIERYLAGIARDVKLDEGAAAIKHVLVELHRMGSMSVQDLAKATRLPPPAISLLLTKMSTDGLVHRDKSGARFTERGMKYVEAEMGILSLSTVSCGACDGTGYELDPEKRHSSLFDRLAAIVAARPGADVTLDQAKCTSETLARRLFLLHEWHAFDGTSILFLGDDDFVSIAACSPEFTGEYFITDPSIPSKPFAVSVLDVDSRILQRIDELAGQFHATNLSVVQHDLREPLPQALHDRYDVVFTDPPYTINGFKLFLSRAVHAMKKEKGSRLFLSFGHVAQETMHDIQAMIGQAGFVIEAASPGFNRYEGGNIIGNMSQLFVLTFGGAGQTPIGPDATYQEGLYTADHSNGSTGDRGVHP